MQEQLTWHGNDEKPPAGEKVLACVGVADDYAIEIMRYLPQEGWIKDVTPFFAQTRVPSMFICSWALLPKGGFIERKTEARPS